MEKIKFGVAILAIAALSACAALGGAPSGAKDTTAAGSKCADCGFIESISVTEGREGIGLGAVLGGPSGAIVGNQVGGGQTDATIAGAAGGAIAGHQIQRRIGNNADLYRVAVRFDDGSRKTVAMQSKSGFEIGDRVRVVEGSLVKAAP